MYDITNWETFHCLNSVKVDVERNKEKKESPVIMILGNKLDLEAESRQIDTETVQKWAVKEKGTRIIIIIMIHLSYCKGVLYAGH